MRNEFEVWKMGLDFVGNFGVLFVVNTLPGWFKASSTQQKKHIKTAFKFLYMGYDGGIAIDWNELHIIEGKCFYIHPC